MIDQAAFEERRARAASLAAIRAGWYGSALRRSPAGRRIYVGDRVRHLDELCEARQSPPSHEAGRDYLRGVLRDWRTEHAVVADWDARHGGVLRRSLVAAGLALQDETDDGRERADALVLQVCQTLSPTTLGWLVKAVVGMAQVPKGPWRSVGSGLSRI